ncbi:MAG: hypothetical protein JG776_1592 [Caloramator sp.]|uniref:sensor histidine kinase n=1 Tax=Caloramator sp. TaxID=1871330 RepID=UPI001DC7287E|nr:histidine kinase [Caloramator sp.]MBZ4663877.1 hypothetical protein [Caloramator sp.]
MKPLILSIKEKKRNLIEWYDNLSLQNKLVISYILVILIPIIIFSFIFFKRFKDNAISDAIKNYEYLLEIEKVGILKNINTMENVAQMVISDKKFIDFIKNRKESSTDELIDFNFNGVANILRLQNSNPNIEHIRLFTNNSYINEIWPIVFNESRVKNKIWFKKTNELNGRTLWYFQDKDDEVVDRKYNAIPENSAKIMLLREVDYPEDEHIGIIEVDMLLKNFFPKMYANTPSPQSQILLIDNKRNIYMDIENDFFKQNKLDISYIRSELNKKINQNRGSFFLDNHSRSVYIVYSYVEEIDSYIVSIISLKEIFSKISRMRNYIIFVTIFLTAILSIITNFINSIVLKKLNILIQSVKRIRKGEFDIDIDVRGSREIGELAHHIRRLLDKINELIAESVNKKAVTKEAELKALQNQIDSHFLYNTLENIKMLAEIEGKYEISDALTSLGDMMRYNMKWTSEYVLLKDEIEHIKNYIALMNIRFDNKISLVINIDESLYEQEILKMSLQPIVENAVKHGIKEDEQFTIEISANRDLNNVVIVIKDYGKGINSTKLKEINYKINLDDERFNNEFLNKDKTAGNRKNSGLGLRNVNQRIKLYYGKEYGICIESKEGGFTVVTVKLPLLILSGGLNSYEKNISS